MPLPRFTKLAPQRQQAILAAAISEFAAHGFDDASFNRIIAKAGISKGAMYYYFADKADLYETVCEHVFDRVAAVVDFEAPNDPQTFWRRLAENLATLVARFVDDAELGALVGHFHRGPAGNVEARVLRWIAEVLAQGQALGAVRDDLPRDFLAAAVAGMLFAADRWLADAMTRLSPEEVGRLATKVLDLARDLLEPRPLP